MQSIYEASDFPIMEVIHSDGSVSAFYVHDVRHIHISAEPGGVFCVVHTFETCELRLRFTTWDQCEMWYEGFVKESHRQAQKGLWRQLLEMGEENKQLHEENEKLREVVEEMNELKRMVEEMKMMTQDTDPVKVSQRDTERAKALERDTEHGKMMERDAIELQQWRTQIGAFKDDHSSFLPSPPALSCSHDDLLEDSSGSACLHQPQQAEDETVSTSTTSNSADCVTLPHEPLPR